MSFASLRKELNVSWSDARRSTSFGFDAPTVTPEMGVATVYS